MAKTINLLPKIAEEELKHGVYRRRVNIFSTVVLVTILLLVTSIFTFRTVQISSLNNLKKSSSAKESSILANQFKEVILRTVNLKLTKVSSILKNSPKYSDYIANLNSLGGGVVFTDLKVDGKVVSFSISARNSDILGVFINNLIDPDIGGKKFKSINLSSLGYSSKDSEYRASLTMESVR